MNITSPAPNAVFTISSQAAWPSIPFQTDATGTHTWNWEVSWNTFKQTGSVTTPSNQWDAQAAVTNFGGTLTVRVQTATDNAIITVRIQATNPAAADVSSFLATKSNAIGFDKILLKESGGRNFGPTGEPIRSFDGGYGMCQLTTPVPSFQQVWNWKSNVEGGLSLFANKRLAAISYLSQSGRTYTPDQLMYETACRWNGGSYHEWDAVNNAWIRHPNILCDSATGSIGWDMTDPENAGKTEADLHQRDSASYRSRPADAHWKYFGVCYADQLLG
jgi:hypothetical protein